MVQITEGHTAPPLLETSARSGHHRALSHTAQRQKSKIPQSAQNSHCLFVCCDRLVVHRSNLLWVKLEL